MSSQGWDHSVSVTDANKCRPVLDVVADLPAHGWTDIGMGESATWVRCRPAKWKAEQSYAVVRGTAERQGELIPRYAVILANRGDLPLAEVVRRHRSKQGHENAFKGPLVDMDLHHPPCRGYRANQAFHACGRMAHMLLRAVQCRLLPKAARRHGIRPLVRHMVRTVARLVTSGRRRSLLFASCCMRRDWLFHACEALCRERVAQQELKPPTRRLAQMQHNRAAQNRLARQPVPTTPTRFADAEVGNDAIEQFRTLVEQRRHAFELVGQRMVNGCGIEQAFAAQCVSRALHLRRLGAIGLLGNKTMAAETPVQSRSSAAFISSIQPVRRFRTGTS